MRRDNVARVQKQKLSLFPCQIYWCDIILTGPCPAFIFVRTSNVTILYSRELQYGEGVANLPSTTFEEQMHIFLASVKENFKLRR
jgi:hypothetical protein